jgi:hypothetical protein
MLDGKPSGEVGLGEAKKIKLIDRVSAINWNLLDRFDLARLTPRG